MKRPSLNGSISPLIAAVTTLPVTRRRVLIKLGGLGLAAVTVPAWRDRSIASASSGGLAASAATCILSPEQTQGPYYIPKEKVRKTVVESKRGMPLKLQCTVVDASTCKPIKGAAVDIWHCDAGGIYSGFVSASTGGPPGGGSGPTDKNTFLRGIQPTNSRGYAEFQTIYPGWYAGRTVHIHAIVHLSGNIIHTGQLYFPDTLTDKVYATGVYKARAARRTTRNANDGIYASGGRQSTLAMKRTKQGYSGTITLGVRRA